MAPQPLPIDELATVLTLIIIKLNCNGACYQPSSSLVIVVDELNALSGVNTV